MWLYDNEHNNIFVVVIHFFVQKYWIF